MLLTNRRWVAAKHLQLLSQKVFEAATQKNKRLIVSMPPRHGKSELISHYAPVWLLSIWPEKRVILASYEHDFAAEWGAKVRDTIEGNQRDLQVRLNKASKAADNWKTTAGGGMFCAGVGGPMTGRGADFLIIDDPIKNAEEARSEATRRMHWDWYRSTARTRVEPGGSIFIVMTRWHEEDLVGKILESIRETPYADRWEVIRFPALAEANDPLGRELDEALWPERYPREVLEELKAGAGSYLWAAMYQQRPSPEEGGLFKREYMRNFYVRAPEQFDYLIQSWDFTFKNTARSDFAVGQVWGATCADRYLLDQVRARMDFAQAIRAVESMSAKWAGSYLKIVEDAANGQAVVGTLKHKIQGLVVVKPLGGKESRAQSVLPQFQAGNVYLPDPSIAPWINDYIEEFAAFPNAAHDDQVDATSQALLHMQDRPDPHMSSGGALENLELMYGEDPRAGW